MKRFVGAFVLALACMPLSVSAGSQTFSTPGTYSFTVPSYGTLTVQVWGGGGGGGTGGHEYYCGSSGNAGGQSYFSSVVANGGSGGVRGGCGNYTGGAGGAGGTASGGTTNTNGASGSQGDAWYFSNNGGAGGTAPGGGAGGAGGVGWVSNGSDGTAPGGGGGGGGGASGGSGGGGGGSGAFSSRSYASGALTAGSSISVRVGSGGTRVDDYYPGYAAGAAGASGLVTVTWTDPPAATCSVWADANPLSYGQSTTLRWSSTNANTMYINSVGYVTPNVTGSATVGPLATTNYDGTATGTGGNGSCVYSLTVNPPATCTFNGSSVAHGASVTAYAAATVPYGSSCVSQVRTCSNGTLSGTYQYASCAVGPMCTLSVAPTSIVQGESATLTLSSQNATSCTGTNVSLGGATSGSFSVAPSQTTAYEATCTGTGGSAFCSASLPVTCPLSWQCTGLGQTITQTNTDCTTTEITTCDAPMFCVDGAQQCISSDVSGTLRATPRFVRPGETTIIRWTSEDADTCTVSGNGESWSDTSGDEASSPIQEFATYTMTCDGHDADTLEDDYIRTVSVALIPSWRER